MNHMIWLILISLSPSVEVSRKLFPTSYARFQGMREAVLYGSWTAAFANALRIGAKLSGSCDVEDMKRKGALWMEPIDRFPQTPRRGRFVRYVEIPERVPGWRESLRAWAREQVDGAVGLRRRNVAILGEGICDIVVATTLACGKKWGAVIRVSLRERWAPQTYRERPPAELVRSVAGMVRIYHAFTGRLPEKLSDLEGTVLVIPPSAKKNRPLMELIQRTFQAIVSVGAPRLQPLGTWEPLKTP